MSTAIVRPRKGGKESSAEAAQGGKRPVLRVAIVGGGIAGLSAAWYLQQGAAQSGMGVHVTVLEGSDRWGGKIRTETVEGFGDTPFVIEAGPDSFLTQKPWALELARELGIEDRVLDTNDHLRQVFVLKHRKPVPLPDGVFLIIPTKIMPFIRSPLISLPGKLRMGLDLLIPPRRDGQDETIADFVERRLGTEAVDRLADPLMSGIYNAEADRQSVLATFPRFRELEKQHGSLIRGMVASRQVQNTHPASNGSGQKRAVFVSMRAGMQELVETLVARLTADLRLNTRVISLHRVEGGYEIDLSSGDRLEVNVVIVTTPAYVTADLVEALAPEAAKMLRAIRYVSTGTISLALRADLVNHPLNGFGLVIPRSEQRLVNAITWTSTKFSHRAPASHVLLRVFFGGSRHPEMMDKDDTELLAIVRAELAALMGIDAEPVLHRIYRWHRGNPQYDVGHLDHIDKIEAALPPGLFLTGSAYRGIGIPDCVHQAQQMARHVLETSHATHQP